MRIRQQFYANFGTHLVSVALTVLVIERLYQRRVVKDRKAELILQMNSPNNALALEAVRILRLKGWHQDGSLGRVDLESAQLQGIHLPFANLQGAHLESANLQGAGLGDANLQGAGLNDANLQGARLVSANLQGAHLEYANLQGARLGYANLGSAGLRFANLQDARLGFAKLQSARLEDANLLGADLWKAAFDENMTLPDGTNWTSDTDMTRFTNPDHPQFWRSDEPWSPAYRGK